MSYQHPMMPEYRKPFAPVVGGQANARGFRPDAGYAFPGPITFEIEWMLNDFRLADEAHPEYDPSHAGELAKHGDNYSNEREVYRMLMMEAFNLHGMPALWHIVTFDTEYDPIFKEDNDKRVERVFPIMMYMPETADNNRIWTLMGIEGVNDFVFWISKEHFSAASQCEITDDYSGGADNENGLYETPFTQGYTPSMNQDGAKGTPGTLDRQAFDDQFDIGRPVVKEHFPKVGDVFKLDYDGGTWFEVKLVKEEDEMFLQRKHCWVISTTKLLINEHINPNKSGVNFDSGFDDDVTARGDEFDQIADNRAIVDSTDQVPQAYPNVGKGKPSPMYNPLAMERPPKNPFGGSRR